MNSNPSIELLPESEPDHEELATHAETEIRRRSEFSELDSEPTHVDEEPSGHEDLLGGEDGVE